MAKICPFLSDANIRHECSEECALSCAKHDYDNDGQVVRTYDKCAFKEMIFELAKLASANSHIDERISRRWN